MRPIRPSPRSGYGTKAAACSPLQLSAGFSRHGSFFRLSRFTCAAPAHCPNAKACIKLPAIGILFYVSAGLTHVVPWIMGQAGEAIEAEGHSWRVHDIRETTVVILLLTMFFTALPAALRLYRHNAPNRRDDKS